MCVVAAIAPVTLVLPEIVVAPVARFTVSQEEIKLPESSYRAMEKSEPALLPDSAALVAKSCQRNESDVLY